MLTHGAVEALSDLLSVDFGLKKLVLEGCGLDDEVSVGPGAQSLLDTTLTARSQPELETLTARTSCLGKHSNYQSCQQQAHQIERVEIPSHFYSQGESHSYRRNTLTDIDALRTRRGF